MDDAVLVAAVAAQYVQQMGSEAVRYLREREEQAASLRDAASAQAWHDIVEAAEAILGAVKSDSCDPKRHFCSVYAFDASAN
jgi:hypothetical protein